MLKKLILGFVVSVGLIVIIGYLLPSTLELEVVKEVDSPTSDLFSNVNDLNQWDNWDPWSKKDPNIKISVKGPEQGMGQIREWKSNVKDVGNGSQKIITSIDNELIETRMQFEGSESKADGWWKFEDLGDNKTKVTWGFRSNMKKPFGGYLALFFKGSIEKNFNKGIDNLVKYTNGE